MPGKSGIVTAFLKQDAIYWGAPVNDGYGGRTYAEPRQIKCRWQDGNGIFIDAEGRQAVSKASLYVGEALELGGYLKLGNLEDLSSAGEEPTEEPGSWEIKNVSTSWDTTGRVPIRKVWLA